MTTYVSIAIDKKNRTQRFVVGTHNRTVLAECFAERNIPVDKFKLCGRLLSQVSIDVWKGKTYKYSRDYAWLETVELPETVTC